MGVEIVAKWRLQDDLGIREQNGMALGYLWGCEKIREKIINLKFVTFFNVSKN